MKRLLTAIAIIACLILPMSAMAMQTIADNELSAITGQAGVSINLDATVNMTFDLAAWGDSDGIGGTAYTNAGWVGLANGNIAGLRLHSRSDAAGMLTPANWGSAIAAYNAAATTPVGSVPALLAAIAANTEPAAVLAARASMGTNIVLNNQFLTIDVGSNAANQTMVRIGLPTVEVNLTSLDANVGLWTNAKTGANYQQMGSLYVGDMNVLIGRDGYVDIYAHAAAGVTMDIFANIDSITIGAVSWGDSDGIGALGTANGAGYVGLINTTVSKIATNAVVTVDVASVAAGGTDFHNRATQYYIKNAAGQCGTTWVDLGISGGATIGELSTTVALGTAKTLANAATTQNVLGDIYAKNLAVSLAAGSWVTIMAH